MDKKPGKKYFGGSEGAGEKKKYCSGGSEKKILFGWEPKKILTSTRTQPTKRLLRTVEGEGAKARERKKNIIRAGAKKNFGVNEDTTHKNAYVQ